MRPHLRKKPTLLISICIVFTFLSVNSSSQEQKPWQFPTALKPSLDARLSLFLNAQAEGRWDYVSELLGNYRRGYWSGYLRFTTLHKTCLISKMRESPMVNFDYQVQESPFSSEILSTPAGRKWWRLVGEATFKSGSKTVRQKTWLTAYRDHGNWFFSPPDIDDADGTQLSNEELLRNRKDEVEMHDCPDCPLEVVDLSVSIDPKDLKVRNIEFRLHNKTNKAVTQYEYEISDEHDEGSTLFGTGAAKDAIEPNGTSHEFKESHVLSYFGCEGEAKMRIELSGIVFADGTEWSPPNTPHKVGRE